MRLRLQIMKKQLRLRIKAGFFALATQSAQAFMAILVFYVGFMAFLSHRQATAGSVHDLLPEWLFLGWAGGLVLGGVLILLGLFMLSNDVERAGCAAVIGSGVIYFIAGFVFHFATIPVSVMWLVLIVALLARYWALSKNASPISED